MPGANSSEKLTSAVAGSALEAVVLGHGPARRQRPPLRGHALERAPKLDLGLEKPVALPAILAGFAREAGVRICRQRA